LIKTAEFNFDSFLYAKVLFSGIYKKLIRFIDTTCNVTYKFEELDKLLKDVGFVSR